MPVLRYDTGNPAGDMLSGIGAALANAMNPKTRWEAYALQQRIMLEQFEYQQKLRAYAAMNAARDQYSHIVPPDQMPEIANLIYQGAPFDQINKAAALASGHLIDDTSPEAYAKNLDFYLRVFGTPPKDGLIDAGPVTIAANNKIRAGQAGAVSEAQRGGELTATQNQRQALLGQMKDIDTPQQEAENLRLWRLANPGQADPAGGIVDVGAVTRHAGQINAVLQAGQLEYQKNFGTESGKQDAINRLTSLLVDDPAYEASNRRVMLAAGKNPDDYTTAVGPNTATKRVQEINDTKGAAAAAEERGRISQQGFDKPTYIPPATPPVPSPTIAGAQPAAAQAPAPPAPAVQAPAPPAPPPPPVSQPAAAAPAPPAPPPPPAATGVPTPASIPSARGPAFLPSPVVQQTPGGGTVILPTEAQAGDISKVNEARGAQFDQAITEGEAAKKLNNALDQLTVLANVAGTGGFTGQLSTAASELVREHTGMTIGTAAEARLLMTNLLNTEIPNLRQQMGIQRLAAPEIKQMSTVIGTADMPTKDILGIIANEKGLADIQIAREDLAQRAKGVGDPINYDDYTNQSNALTATLKQRVNDYAKQYGAPQAGGVSTQPRFVPDGKGGYVPVPDTPPPPAVAPAPAPPAVTLPPVVPAPAAAGVANQVYGGP